MQKWDYFNFDALSKRFQKILLDLIEKELGSDFKKERWMLYKKYDKGFYVYAEKKKFKSLKDGIEYVTRYCKRAPISKNRIINYDGKKVTFSYNGHKDNSYHEVTVSADQFILLILLPGLQTSYFTDSPSTNLCFISGISFNDLTKINPKIIKNELLVSLVYLTNFVTSKLTLTP